VPKLSNINSVDAQKLYDFIKHHHKSMPSAQQEAALLLLANVKDNRAYTTRQLTILALAQEQAREGEVEVDAEAVVSEGDDPGAYVQAWMWVPYNEDKED
jgi:hypothetical protein